MWEDIEKGVFRKNKRIISVLKFENVINVNSKNLNQKNTERFLDFLAIETKLLSDKNYEVKLNFAGDILIKLNLEIIECFLEDISDPWETKNKPKSKLIENIFLVVILSYKLFKNKQKFALIFCIRHHSCVIKIEDYFNVIWFIYIFTSIK